MNPHSKIICIGGSAGSGVVIGQILAGLPAEFRTPIVIVKHRHKRSSEHASKLIQHDTQLPVIEPNDKDPISPGHVYLAPPDYHLLIGKCSFHLSLDPPEHYARPSINIMFQSAALTFREGTTAIVLSGYNDDGAVGAAAVDAVRGKVFVQALKSAEFAPMPSAAKSATPGAIEVQPSEIPRLLMAATV